MAEETLNEKLTKVSEELQIQTTTRLACDKLIEGGSVKIIDTTEQKEGVEPIAINLSGDVVANVLRPVVDLVNAKRERLLAIKEQILNQIQAETVGK